MDSTLSLDDIHDDSQCAENLHATIHTAMQAEETLESIQAQMEEERVDEHAAALASIAIESIRNQLNLPAGERVVPAFEHFVHPNSVRSSASKVVVEGIRDFLVEIWKKIKDAAQAFFSHVVEVFEKIRTGVFFIERELDRLQTQFDKLSPSSQPREKSLNNPRLAKLFWMKGEASGYTARQMANHLKDLKDFSVDMAVSVGATARIVLVIADMVREGKDLSGLVSRPAEEYNAGIALINAQLNRYKKTAPKGFKKNQQEYKEEEYFGPFVGNHYLVLSKSDIKLHGLTSTSFSVRLQKGEAESKESIDALTYHEVKTILLHTKRATSEYQTILKAAPEYRKIGLTLQKTSEEIIQTLMRASTTQISRDFLAILRFQVRDVVTTSNTIANQIPVLMLNAIKGHLDYLRLSIKNLEA